jgi:Ser/Thr protein kinase RdoA (MazF antagonist)
MVTEITIREILKFWGIYSVSEWRAMQRKIFRITTGDGRQLILKNISDKNDEWRIGRLPLEYEVLSHVHQLGVSVAVPMLSHDGMPYVVFSEQVYCLYPYFTNNPGEVKNASDRRTLYQNYGAAIARLHQALVFYPDKSVSERTWRTDLLHRIFDEAIPCISEYLSREQNQAFTQMVDEMEAEMRRAYSDLPEQLIAWDCHPGNIVVDGFEVSGFVDCNHLSIGPRIFDLAYFLVHLVKWDVGDEHKTATWLAHYNQIIVGYERVQPLEKRERERLFYVMLAVLLIFIDHLYRSGELQNVKVNLDTFAWMYYHRQEIMDRVNSLSTFKAAD